MSENIKTAPSTFHTSCMSEDLQTFQHFQHVSHSVFEETEANFSQDAFNASLQAVFNLVPGVLMPSLSRKKEKNKQLHCYLECHHNQHKTHVDRLLTLGNYNN